MADDHNQQDDEQKEVTSTQANEFHLTDIDRESEEKIILSLPFEPIKPSSNFKLVSYSGDDSQIKIQNWIRMYENLAKRSDWSNDEMKWNLVSYLEREALDYYVEQVLSKNLDWMETKQSILKRFDKYEIAPFMKLLTIKWTPQTDLKEYFKQIRALGFAAGLKEEDILSCLTRSLPSPMRSELIDARNLKQWASIAHYLQQRILEDNNYSNRHPQYKNGRIRNRQTRSNKSRNNLPSEHALVQNASNSNNDHNEA